MNLKTLSQSKRKAGQKLPGLLRQAAAIALLIIAAVVVSCQARCNCGVTFDESLAKLEVVDGGGLHPNSATALSLGATGREDGYHVTRSFTRAAPPGAYATKFGFAFSVPVDVGCDAYFRHPLPGLTDGDKFTLYVRMRVFDLGEDDQRTRPGETFVGSWSDEIAVTCHRANVRE